MNGDHVRAFHGFEGGDDLVVELHPVGSIAIAAGAPVTSEAWAHGQDDDAEPRGTRSLLMVDGDAIDIYPDSTPDAGDIVRIAQRWTTFGSLLLELFDGSDVVTASVEIGADGKARIYRGTTAGTLLATSTTALVVDTPYTVDVEATVADAGEIMVYLNHVEWVTTGAADTMQGSTWAYERISVGDAGEVAIDDLVHAAAGVLPAEDTYVPLRRPVSNDQLESDVGYTAIDEDPLDLGDETTFGDGDTDRYGLSDFSAAPGEVYAVRAIVRATETVGGGGVFLEITSGGSDGSSGQVAALIATPLAMTWDEDPATNAPWDAVAAEQITAGVHFQSVGGGEGGGGGNELELAWFGVEYLVAPGEGDGGGEPEEIGEEPEEVATALWLLDVDLGGRTYRWSTERALVPTAAGDLVEYVPGLVEEPVGAVGDEFTIQVLDPDMDWPQLSRELELAPAILRRWGMAEVLERAQTFALGRVTFAGYGARGERIEFEIVADDAADLSMPDPTAVCDASTWPVRPDPPHSYRLLEDMVGFPYPVIFGVPGWDGVSDTPKPVVPVPMCEFRAGSWGSKILFADRLIPATQAYVKSDAYDDGVAAIVTGNGTYATEAWLPLAADTDLLGRQVTTADLTSVDLVALLPGGSPDAPEVKYYAGFHPDYGGGHVRNAYDVIEFLLRTWGRAPTDWVRLRNVEELLSRFQVDTWLNDTDRPWEWILATLVPFLPVVPRLSTTGRYLERIRPYATAEEATASISVDRGEAERRGDILWKGGDTIMNEVVLEYRQLRNGTWTSRRILSARSGQSSRAFAGTETDSRVVGHPLCAASQARRWGVRSGDVVQVGWSWDDTTILRVGQHIVESFALPRREVTMLVRDGDQLETGSVVLLSDEEMALDDEVAIVDAPPVFEPDGVAVTFRLPEQV